MKAIFAGIFIVLCGGSQYLLAGEAGGEPKVTLHLSFENSDWVAHASGVPGVLAMDSDLVEGKVGKGARIMNRKQAGLVDILGNMDKAQGTVTFWYKPEFDRGKKETYPLLWSGTNNKVGKNSFWLWLWHGSLRFDVRDPADSYCTVSAGKWKVGEWVHIAAAWDCKKGLSLWVNGVKAREQKATWEPVDTQTLLVGSGEGRVANLACGGVIDEVKIFDRPLDKAQIMGDFSGAVKFAYADKLPADKLPAEKLRRKVAKKSHKKEPLKTLFHLDFEDGYKAKTVAGDYEPTNKNLPAFVDGVVGKGVTLKQGQVLRYLSKDVITKDRGAFSAWVRTVEDENFGARRMIILREDGPTGIGKNALWLWVYEKHGLRVDPRDPDDSYSVIGKSWSWKRGEWHHVIFCWDCEIGTMCYLDGQLVSNGGGGDSGKTFIPLKWTPCVYDAFFLGADRPQGINPWRGVMDEVKFYNRPLEVQEALDEYSRVCKTPVVAEVLDPYLYEGKVEKITLAVSSLSPKAAKYGLSYSLVDSAGAEVASGKIGTVAIASGEVIKIPVDVKLPAKGEYELKLNVSSGADSSIAKMTLYALAAQEPEENVERKLVLVDEVDAVALDTVVESAPSKIVDSPIGKYREAGQNRNDRFALKFDIEEPFKPHVAVVTYPDDKARTMEAMLQPLEVGNDYQAQTGVYTGDEYPLSNGMLQQKIVFWPQCKQMSFVFMTVEAGCPAAVKDMKIYRMQGGFKRLDVKPFKGSVPARTIGLYHEDPVLPLCYGKVRSNDDVMPFMPDYETVITRLMDYHQSFGQDTLHYPIAWYHGPLYGSLAEPHTVSTRPHPRGFPKYLMRRLATRGMKFNGWFHMHQIESIRPYIILDEERVFAGEETPINMRYDNHLFYRAWHGKDPVLNPLDSRVQDAVKKIVREVAERYGDEPNFTGITLNTVRHSIFAFGSLESGYNDVNLKNFQKDTGLTIPVDSKDRYRFAKSWKWLMENAKQEWVDWRCRKIHEYYKELAAILTAKRKDLTLGVVAFSGPTTFMNCDYLNAGGNPLRGLEEQGINPMLYENDKDIVMRTSMVPADLRWRRGHGKPAMGIEDWRTINLAPEVVKPIANTLNASVNMHDRYFEDPVARSNPLKGLTVSRRVRECGWRVSALNANTYHGIENHVAAMNNLDPFTITKGGFLVGSFGFEEETGRFSQAFRALPAVKFDDVSFMFDPVRVRQKVVDGKNYFYVLNRLPYEVKAEIKLSGGGEVVDLVTGNNMGKSKLTLTLKPYDLRSFSTAKGTVVDSGFGECPAEVVAALKKKVADMGLVFERMTAKGIDVSEYVPYLDKARECLETGCYARLYFLLQESWVNAVKRLGDRTMQAFLKMPKDYLAKRQARKISLVAEKAGGKVKIDGVFDEAAWAKAKACDDMDDFLVYKGDFIAKPAENKMSVKMLYDNSTLYLAIHCEEKDPSKVLVKSGMRDGALWSGDDAVEIFLHTQTMGPKGHAQLAVNAGSSRTDLLSGSMGWNGEWSAASKVVADGWETEVAIPFATIANGATAKSGWSFNIARTRRAYPKSALIGDKTYEWKCVARFVNIQMN